jgi:hypothetical protein
MKHLKIFNESILNNYKQNRSVPRVAIVGNGGTSKTDADFISDADAVIRFNNFGTRKEISHEISRSKCDILFSTFDLHSHTAAPKDVVIGIPFPFHAKDIALKMPKWYPSAREWMVNPYTNMEMCAEMGCGTLGHEHPFPSIGFTALWHMQYWKAEFYVTGFEWYFDDVTHKFQNWDIRNTQYPKNWNHNYPKEVKWIIENLLNKNNFIFSDRSLYILNVAKQLFSNAAH